MKTALRRLPITEALALAVFAFATLLYLRGAVKARPSTATGANDLQIVRAWMNSGHLSDHPTDNSHLAKPGYLLYLRLLLPHAGADSAENRRFLIFNSLWILVGAAIAMVAIKRSSGTIPALFFLTFLLLYFPARDSADYIASEPAAIGLGLLFVAALSMAKAGPLVYALALLSAVCVWLRPNLGLFLFLILVLVQLQRGASRKWLSVAALVLTFACGLAFLNLAGSLAGMSVRPLRSSDTAKSLLWGTADYYWKPDVVGGWPTGATEAETARLQREKTRARWKALLGGDAASRDRALKWRIGHSILSAEQLPPRLTNALYIEADKAMRRWWWALSALLIAASAAIAVRGAGSWRFVPIVAVMAIVAQGLAFGADPRLAMPFIPVIAFGLAIALPSIRRDQWALGSAFTSLLVVLSLVASVPDSADSDFAMIVGPGRVIEQRVSRGHFRQALSAQLHLRVLQEPPFPLGLKVYGNGRLLLSRAPLESADYPAALVALLNATDVQTALRDGLLVRLETFGSASTDSAFAYYPVVPPVFSGESSMDGSTILPSGYGGSTRGGISVWVTTTGP